MSLRYSSPRHREIVKDTMIDDLRAENDDLRYHDNNLEVMEDTLHSVQYALDKATGGRLKLENDFKIQVDNDAITINRLKNEGIDLKHALADRNEEIARLRSTLSNLKYTVDLKAGDLAHLNEEFRINKEDNDHLKATANGLDADVRAEIDSNNALRRELDDLHNRIDSAEVHQKELEIANAGSRANQDRLNRDIDDCEHRIRDVTAQISVLEGKARGLRIDLDHLEATCGDLRGKLDAEIDLSNRLRPDLEREIQRGRDLEAAHARLVDTIEDRRAELSILRKQLDELNIQVRDISATNADLEYQINELKRHIEVLTRQNADLNVEIDQILHKNEEMLNALNRMKSIAEKQKANEQNLLKSLATLHIQRKREGSPVRSGEMSEAKKDVLMKVLGGGKK